jgi:putative salt-induced outer membrane protein YdiY
MKSILFASVSIASMVWCAGGSAREPALPAVFPPPGSGLSRLPTVDLPDSDLFGGPTPLDASMAEPVAGNAAAAKASADIVPELVPRPDALLSTTPVDEILDPAPKWYESRCWFGPAPWVIRYELGINGSKGENGTFSMRTGGEIKRETECWKVDSSISFNQNTANRVETQNNAKFDSRLDRLLGDSPWTLYFLTNLLYDKFQAFDMRLTLNTGVGYHFLDSSALNLLGRFGAGASREFGGPDDHTPQELLFGLDYEHHLSNMQRLTAKVDYFPEWNDFNQYRVVSDISWEIDLDRPENVSLKLSVQDRYDSTAGDVAPNLFNYAVLMIWSL